MAFNDCLRSAVDQGAIQADEADELQKRFDAYVASHRGTDDPLGPEGLAKKSLAKALDDEAQRKFANAERQKQIVAGLADHAQTYRTATGKVDVVEAFMGVLDNGNNTLAGVPSVTGRRNALIGYAHGKLEQMLYETRRSFTTGARRGGALLHDMVDEAFGAGSGNEAAKGFLTAWRTVADEFVDRFNAAGGAIGKRERYFPQSHDSRKIARAGEQGWIDGIKPLLDPAAMRDPVTGGPMNPANLDAALSHVYRRIVTDGAIDMQPSAQVKGRGALANQRQEERFLMFKDADSWRQYNQSFGRGDAWQAMNAHLNGLAKDIAALEVLGPNPNATVEWMGQVVQQEAARRQVGEASLYNGKSLRTSASGTMDTADRTIRRLWSVVNGSVGTGNLAVADGMAALRNFLTAVQLPQAVMSAVAGDPFQQRNARAFAGVPQMRWLADLPRQMFSGASQRDITRAGVVFSDAMEHLQSDVRRLSLTAASAELSKWLPDRIFQWTGLTPWTNVNRRAQAMSFMFEAGDRLSQSFEAIAKDGEQGRKFARWLEGHGIGADEWAKVQQARALDHGEAGALLRPMDLFDLAGDDKALFDIGLRYSEAVHGFMEQAVPTGTARVRAAAGGGTAPGTLQGEMARSMTMYLNYPVNVLFSMMRGVVHEQMAGGGRGLAYATTSLIGLTIGGAITLQLMELRKGRDPRPVNNPEFWALALAKGGALGFYGDFLLGDYKRGTADTLSRIPGPVASLSADALALANPRASLGDDESNRGRRAVDMLRRYTPVQGMWWLKPVADRMVWDRLQEIADPDAHRAWRRAERKLHNETGQGQWWGRAQGGPSRGPDMGKLWE